MIDVELKNTAKVFHFTGDNLDEILEELFPLGWVQAHEDLIFMDAGIVSPAGLQVDLVTGDWLIVYEDNDYDVWEPEEFNRRYDIV